VVIEPEAEQDCPAPHVVHDVCPAFEYEPAAHTTGELVVVAHE